jgi:cob(I)alamin adenosyltransferase
MPDDNPADVSQDPPKSMLYTRSGDDGTTGLFGGGRVPKDHPRVEAYGTVDELNSAIGVAIAFNSRTAHSEGTRRTTGAESLDIASQLTLIQNELFNIGSELASESAGDKAASFAANFTHAAEKIKALEDLTDKLDAAVPPLETFILPSGSQGGAMLHLCRTICRRAEREVVRLARLEPVNPDITRYLNRLSDYLFALARYLNQVEGQPETPWQKGATQEDAQ